MLIALMLACALPAAAADEPERSPFDMVRFAGDDVHVMVKGTWYELVELNGLSLRSVMEACRRLDPRRPRKRFCEDLTAALGKAGKPLGKTADLIVTKPGSSRRIRLDDVPVTEAKRDRIRDARPWREVPRIERTHATSFPRRFAWLQTRHRDDENLPRLTQAAAHADLDQLEWLVEHRHSYRDLRAIDWRAAFDAVRLGIGRKGITRADFHIQLSKLVGLLGDCHAGIGGLWNRLPPGGLPFRLRAVKDGVLAVDRDGRPIERDAAYVRSIDGVPIDEWIEAAARLGPHGSPQFRRANGLLYGCHATFVRGELGLRRGRPLEVTLKGTGGATKRRTMQVAERARPWYRTPDDTSRTLPGNVGYLRIGRMHDDERAIARVLDAVRSHRKAKGLILDIRHNPGGSRDILRTLLPHLMRAGAKPLVVNVAALRLEPGDDEDDASRALRSRHLLRPDSDRFTNDASRAAATTLERFRPDWKLDPEAFSNWHAMVVEPAPRDTWRFTRRIALLIDAHSFSASDVFAGALEQLPHVTLIGEATGGGSGRKVGALLRHSALEVDLSSMASFRPNGHRYDGRGIEPDLEVVPTLADVLAGRDPVLERARAHVGR